MTAEEYYNKYKDCAYKCFKLQIPIKAEQMTSHGFIETKEGIVNYNPGEYIVTEATGEKYTIEKDFFEENYIAIDNNGYYQIKYIDMEAMPILGENVTAYMGPNNYQVIGRPSPGNCDILVRDKNGQFIIVENKTFKRTYLLIRKNEEV